MTGFSIKVLSHPEYRLWDSFVASSPQGTIFSTTTWASIIAKVFGVQPTIYAVLQKDELVGGISSYYKRKFGLRVSSRLPLTPYNGILFRSPNGEKPQKILTHQQEILDLILGRLENEFQFVHFVLHPSVTDLRGFLWRRWDTIPQYTYVVPLADLPRQWTLLSSSLRRKISRAEEKKFRIFQKTDSTLLLEFQEMSYAKSRLKPVISITQFKRFCEAAAQENLLRIYSAVDTEGNVHAERAIIVHRHHAYDWIAGTNLHLEDQHANQLLVWEIFKRLSSNGIQTFDFLGGNTPSVIEFKRAFGGELVSYVEVAYFSSWIVRGLSSLNESWINLRRKVKL